MPDLRDVLLPICVVMLALFGVQTLRLAAEQRGHAETRRAYAEELTRMADAARQATQAARTEEHRRYVELEIISRKTAQALDLASADSAAARTAAERLHQRLAAITATCHRTPEGTAVATGSPPAGTAADLLADVQRRTDEALRSIAGFADQSHLAGLACESAYHALSPNTPLENRPVSPAPTAAETASNSTEPRQ